MLSVSPQNGTCQKTAKTQTIFVEKEVGLGNYAREFQNKEIALLNLS